MIPDYLEKVDVTTPEFGELFDELPLWSAPFGLLLLEQAPVKAGMTILDVGAGSGFLALELAQRYGPGTDIVAVDPWSTAMARLRKKLARLSLENVEVIESDVLEADLPAEHFDLIVSNLGVNNFADKLSVFKNLSRMLKPNGKLCTTTNLTGHFEEFYAVFEETCEELSLPTELLHEHISARGNQESICAELVAGGFEMCRFDVESFTMRFANGSAFLRHLLIRAGFVPGWMELVPSTRVDEFFARLEQRMNERAQEKRSWTVTVPVAYIEAEKTP